MVPAYMELTAQGRRHPVPASHSLESMGQKGDPLTQLEKEGSQDKCSCPDTDASQYWVHGTHGLLNRRRLFQEVWAVWCPGVCKVLGCGGAGDPQATLGEVLIWGEKRVCAEAEG